MNVADIVILAVIGVSALWGLYRGFIQSVLGMAGTLLSLLAAYVFGPRLAALMRANQGIADTLSTYTDAVARVGDATLAGTNVAGMDESLLARVLDSVGLPKPISDILMQNISTQAFAQDGLVTVNQYVQQTLVAVAINVLCYMLVFLAAMIVCSVIINLVRHVADFPSLKAFNVLLGGVFGLARGVVVTYVLFLLVPILLTVLPIDGLSQALAESTLAPVFQSEGFFSGVITGLL